MQMNWPNRPKALKNLTTYFSSRAQSDTFMYSFRETYITKAILIVFFLVVLAYGYYEVRGLLYGPQIHIGFVPSETTEQFIVISGSIDHTSSLSINGKEVTVTQDGQFHYPYLLAYGNNQIYLDARDKYGSKAHKVVQVDYFPVASTTTLVQ